MKTYRVAIIGFAHMHINDVASHFFENPRTDLVACADTTPAMPELRAAPYTRAWNREFCVRNFKIPRVYDDHLRMLDEEKPDIAIVTSENVLHREIVQACAERGVHACVEKPMAVSLSDALAMGRAAGQYGIKLLVNWPITWIPAYRTMKRVLDEGAIGRLIEFKIRTSHTGPLGAGATHKGVSEAAAPMSGQEKAHTWWHQLCRGGGAMYDFCCYGSMLSHWLANQDAVAAFGLRANLMSPYGDADDNAVMVVRFPGCVALIETSWTTPKELLPSNIPMLYGTEGAMTLASVDGRDAVKLLKPGMDDQWFFPGDVLEQDRDIARAFVHHLDTGEDVHPTLSLERNISAMRILDAGVRSAGSGKLEVCNDACWQIG